MTQERKNHDYSASLTHMAACHRRQGGDLAQRKIIPLRVAHSAGRLTGVSPAATTVTSGSSGTDLGLLGSWGIAASEAFGRALIKAVVLLRNVREHSAARLNR